MVLFQALAQNYICFIWAAPIVRIASECWFALLHNAITAPLCSDGIRNPCCKLGQGQHSFHYGYRTSMALLVASGFGDSFLSLPAWKFHPEAFPEQVSGFQSTWSSSRWNWDSTHFCWQNQLPWRQWMHWKVIMVSIPTRAKVCVLLLLINFIDLVFTVVG